MRLTIFIFLIIATSSCASVYKSIDTNKIEFSNYISIKDSIEISYNYNTQTIFNNTKYKKAERRFDYTAISVKIINNTSTDLILEPDLFIILDDGKPANIVSSENYVNNVRQVPEYFLLYGIFGPWISKNGTTKYIPLGLGFGVLNLVIASYANNMHRQNMKKLEIWGKTVESNSALTGIIFLKNYSFGDLNFNYLKR